MNRTAYTAAKNDFLGPWTPVSVTRNKTGVSVFVWGREYRFDAGQVFPSSIITGGDELLAGPVVLGGISRGGKLFWSDEEPGLIVHTQNDAQAVILGSVRSVCGEFILNTCCRVGAACAGKVEK